MSPIRTLEDQAADLHDIRELRQQFLDFIHFAEASVERLNRMEERRAGLAHAPSLERVVKARQSKPQTDEPEPQINLPSEIVVKDESVGRFGLVNYELARRKAQALGEFTSAKFAKALGLKSTQVMRWLSQMHEEGLVTFASGTYTTTEPPELLLWVVTREEEPFSLEDAAYYTRLTPDEVMAELDKLMGRNIVEQVNGNGTFKYIETDPRQNPREHETKTPPEREPPNYADVPPRGMPVRIDKSTRRQRSTAGAGGIKGVRQRNARREAQEKAKEARAQESRTKAQRDPKWKSQGGKRKRAA